jgi:hypothetical protein
MKTEIFSASSDAGTNSPNNINDVCAQSVGLSGITQWSSDGRRCGRPRGELREMLDSWSRQNPEFTMGQMCRSLGMPMQAANNTLRRALVSGDLHVSGYTRTPEAKRPVAVYERATSQSGALNLSNQMRVWL